MDNRKKLLLAGGGFLVIVLFVIGLAFQVNKKSDLQTKTSTNIDPATGEMIVDVQGKSPEKESVSTGPSVVGASAVYPLFGDELVFSSIQEAAFTPLYQNHSVVRIAKDSVTKKVDTINGITTITVTFQVYLDKDNSKKDTFTVSYNQDTTEIYITAEGDYSKKTSFATTTSGND